MKTTIWRAAPTSRLPQVETTPTTATMDHADPHPHACSLTDKRRRAEPFIFFFGTLGLALIAIILVVWTAHQPVGPESAQRPAAPHADH